MKPTKIDLTSTTDFRKLPVFTSKNMKEKFNTNNRSKIEQKHPILKPHEGKINIVSKQIFCLILV